MSSHEYGPEVLAAMAAVRRIKRRQELMEKAQGLRSGWWDVLALWWVLLAFGGMRFATTPGEAVWVGLMCLVFALSGAQSANNRRFAAIVALLELDGEERDAGSMEALPVLPSRP